MKHLLSVDEFYRCNSINESNYQSRNEKTVEYKGFEYIEDPEVFNPVESGWSKKEIDDFYNKKNNVLFALNDLNIAQRGHKVMVYDDEIAVYGINVPLLADCRQIAKDNQCDYKEEQMFDCFIFYL